MNYLDLCKSLIIECGITGTLGAVTGQIGEFQRVVTWIRDAWTEIQNNHDDWGFMRSSYLNGGLGTTFTTTNGRAVYPLGNSAGTTCMVPVASFGKWDPYTFRIFTTTNVLKTDETDLELIGYDDWRDNYMMGAQRQVASRPSVVAVAPDNAVCLGCSSNGLYSVEGDYFVAPQVFAADGDVPTGLLAQYHMLIVYRAMKKYAGYEAAPEVAIRAEDEGNPMYRQLEAKFGPQMQDGYALA